MSDVVSVLWAITMVMCPGPETDCPISDRVETRIEIMRADGCRLADKACQASDLVRVTRSDREIAAIAADVLTAKERAALADMLRSFEMVPKPRDAPTRPLEPRDFDTSKIGPRDAPANSACKEPRS